jgi:hypothetical protein
MSLFNSVVFAATILCARTLVDLPDRPSPTKFCTVDRAIDHGAFILKRIDEPWPEAEP